VSADAVLEPPSPPPALHRWTGKLGDLWRARELLGQLVRKELKVRYRNSALGFLWSMLTPALMTVVFSIIFGQVVPIPVPDFPAFFIAGFLLWQFFQNSCQGGMQSIVGNGDLVKKVYFPREVLPLSHVLAQLAHLLLALVVISPYLIATRGFSVIAHLPALLLAIGLLTIFTSGVAMLLSGVNVVFRDLQELFVVLYLVWFYVTPVLYPRALAESMLAGGSLEWAAGVLQWNPMTWFVEGFRTPLYGDVVAIPGTPPIASTMPTWPGLGTIAAMAAWAAAAAVIGYLVFLRRARTFAKEV
jgi:ABC-type polysaccharide/polyol phosphate export permease